MDDNQIDQEGAETENSAILEFFPTRKGGRLMAHNAHLYCLERRTDKHLYWSCNLKGVQKCPARCQTSADFSSVIIRNSNHNHPTRIAEIAQRRQKYGQDLDSNWFQQQQQQQDQQSRQ